MINNEKNDIYNRYFKIGGWNDYYIQATSNLSNDILSKAFDINRSKVITSGYPRNYILQRNIGKVILVKKSKVFWMI